eukprot:scaffold4264_cov116-Isochrysis_galbana.AAC.5
MADAILGVGPLAKLVHQTERALRGGVGHRRLVRDHACENGVGQTDGGRLGGDERADVSKERNQADHAQVESLAAGIRTREQQHSVPLIGRHTEPT